MCRSERRSIPSRKSAHTHAPASAVAAVPSRVGATTIHPVAPDLRLPPSRPCPPVPRIVINSSRIVEASLGDHVMRTRRVPEPKDAGTKWPCDPARSTTVARIQSVSVTDYRHQVGSATANARARHHRAPCDCMKKGKGINESRIVRLCVQRNGDLQCEMHEWRAATCRQ